MTCGCGETMTGCLCDERVAQTPLPIANRPGLPSIRRRVATHATAKATMMRALSRGDLLATKEFTNRTDDDFAVALIDAAAVVADVVTFYTETFSNEHYVRTATERSSVGELARLLGYQVRPGLAPTADLAFTIDPTPGAPAETLIAAGTGVQSSPDPGQLPVVYETLADIVASPAWNAMRPRQRVPHRTDPVDMLTFAGAIQVAAGDGVLFRTGEPSQPLAFGIVRTVQSVDAVHDLPGKPGSPARTLVTVKPVGHPASDLPAARYPAPSATGPIPGSVHWLAGKHISAADLDAQLLARSATLNDIAGPFVRSAWTPAEALLFRQQRNLFGSQAPISSSMTASIVLETGQTDIPLSVRQWAAGLALPWETGTVQTFPGAQAGVAYLDGGSPSVPVGSVLVLVDGDTWGGYEVTAAAGVALALKGISGRTTRVTLEPKLGLNSFSIRGSTAYVAPAALALADVPAAEQLGKVSIELDGLMLGLREGRPVVVIGEPIQDLGHPLTFSTTLSNVEHDFGRARTTTVTFADSLPAPLARSTTTICANVAPASQGETRREVVGGGDGRQVFQSFTLRQPPLTYLSADTAEGLVSTLEVWVDEVRWSVVGSFVGTGPNDRVYVVRDRNGQTVIQFGDGVTGARLPTGTVNVRAVYRTGGDLSGRVRAGQLSLPTSRAGGVTGVLNPAASRGGDDPEPVGSARTSAPIRVTTIDRVVSMADYALFARSFPGIAKAQAVWARAATHRGVLLTVAGNHGTVVDATKGIGSNLLGAFKAAGDPLVPVGLVPYQPRSFRIAVSIRTAPDRIRTDVLAGVSARLRQAFSFEARELGQPVAASELLGEIHSVTGVVAATIASLWTLTTDTPTEAPTGPPPTTLTALAPAPGVDIDTLSGAELLVLDAAPISWGVLQ